MAYQKSPSYLWQNASGLWHLKRPIPPKLQHHYPSKTPGKLMTHWVESLGTHNRAEAEQLKRAPLRLLEAEFTRHGSGLVSKAASRHAERLASLRQSMADVLKDGGDEGTELAIVDMALEAAEAMEADHGPQAASMAFKLATQPDKLTLREALAERHKVASTREQTKASEVRALDDLLEFLGVPDCLPESVTEAKALQFVDALNDGPLSHATKKGRLSCLGRLWKGRKVTAQLPRALHTLWEGHDVKGERKSTAEAEEETGRVWTPAEMVKTLAAPNANDKRRRTYTRPLFRELYALGFATGMRLDEITSLRPVDLTTMDGGIVVNIRKAKTDAGLRSIPVVHPVAVRVLQARADAQKDPKGLLFSECQPGGPDNKTSWHVSKALGKDRDRLKLDAVTFHSTRATFMTLQENAGTNYVHVQRYVGHVIDTVMHTDYSGGSSVETLKAIALAVRYPAEVEQALAGALGSP
jgi:integrase